VSYVEAPSQRGALALPKALPLAAVFLAARAFLSALKEPSIFATASDLVLANWILCTRQAGRG
jgi:hypothetical protein